MRPSKLRLPDSTETTARSASSTACGDLRRERAGVADAGRAAVADEVEAELLQRLGQPGAVEVVGDDLRARRERGLHPRLARRPRATRVAREDARADHHRRVGGVGAARDRGDHHVAVVELERSVAVGERAPASSPLAALRRAQPAAAWRRRPCSASVARAAVVGSGRSLPLAGGSLEGKLSATASSRAVVVAGRSRAAPRWKALCGVAQRDAVLRALGPGEARLDARRGRARASSENVGFSERSSCHRPCSLA